MPEVKVYNAGTDEFITVTQEWCDSMTQGMGTIVRQRDAIHAITKLNARTDVEKIRAISKAIEEILK